MKESDIKNPDTLLYVGVKGTDVQRDEDLYKAEWVNVNDELPTEAGFYFVLTDEHLTKGIAGFFKDDDSEERTFDICYATAGKEPKVLYWLKDNHWGMVYRFKKAAGELK